MLCRSERSNWPPRPRRAQRVQQPVFCRGHGNGVEPFWSTLKRARKDTFHKVSRKHLQRYGSKFAEKYNHCDAGTGSEIPMRPPFEGSMRARPWTMRGVDFSLQPSAMAASIAIPIRSAAASTSRSPTWA